MNVGFYFVGETREFGSYFHTVLTRVGWWRKSGRCCQPCLVMNCFCLTLNSLVPGTTGNRIARQFLFFIFYFSFVLLLNWCLCSFFLFQVNWRITLDLRERGTFKRGWSTICWKSWLEICLQFTRAQRRHGLRKWLESCCLWILPCKPLTLCESNYIFSASSLLDPWLYY